MLSKRHREKLEKSGKFELPDGLTIDGILTLDGSNTTLELYSDRNFDPLSSSDIFGRLYDHTKISLIDCITSGLGHGGHPEEPYYFSSIFPHFVLLGEKHISSSCRQIQSLSFTTDDASKIFEDFDVFGSVIGDSKRHLQAIVDEGKLGREIEIGDHPQIFYYTGKRSIFSADTALGKITAWHNFGGGIPGTDGILFSNQVRLIVEFHERKTVEETISTTLDMLRFLELIAGRKQVISDLSFNLEEENSRPELIDVYWCHYPTRDEREKSKSPHVADLLIHASQEPEKFASVLQKWLSLNSDFLPARVRFSTAFSKGNYYSIDRIVGIANAFDILPLSIFSEQQQLSEDLATIVSRTASSFKKLPQSPERDSILGTLGRIGKPFLKTKVRNRAQKITDCSNGRFPHLEDVVDEAINCRNYYVHGSESKFSYEDHKWLESFFTDTLEFVFAASDLIDCGWDLNEWLKRGTIGRHPFGNYKVNYRSRVDEFLKLLKAVENSRQQ